MYIQVYTCLIVVVVFFIGTLKITTHMTPNSTQVNGRPPSNYATYFTRMHSFQGGPEIYDGSPNHTTTPNK